MSLDSAARCEQLAAVRSVVVGRCLGEGDAELARRPLETDCGRVVERLVTTTTDVEDQTDRHGLAGGSSGGGFFAFGSGRLSFGCGGGVAAGCGCRSVGTVAATGRQHEHHCRQKRQQSGLLFHVFSSVMDGNGEPWPAVVKD